MNINNNIMKYTTVLFAFLILTLTACYKDNPLWLDQNIKKGGTYYPLLQEFYATPDTASVGDKVQLSVVFWSRDDVKQLEFYRIEGSTETLISTAPFDATPDIPDPDDKDADLADYSEAWIQSVEYIVPTVDSTGTTIQIKAVVRTVNDLTRDATTEIVVK